MHNIHGSINHRPSMCLDTAFEQGKCEARRIYADMDNCPYPEGTNEASAWIGGYYEEKKGNPSRWADDHGF